MPIDLEGASSIWLRVQLYQWDGGWKLMKKNYQKKEKKKYKLLISQKVIILLKQ